ncbi:MaoC family dehydratase [Oxalobacteraceae bacterium R-40]|uniref:MaoC family dehydratase n=1 Tax=Keguizhuia sedimenti TaxID=3064264 RepID=A0ABU1BP51_9BURK|nr:MaoC family dehydratase [Oxalobacteraceae bacterium R-40]
MQTIPSLVALAELTGQEIAVSDWALIDQDRINRFAAATGDQQWIHLDSERCRQEPGVGSTIAHGFLTLSLISTFMQESIDIGGIRMALNYGLNKVRFPMPVPAGSRVRARFTLLSLEATADSVQAAWQAVIETDGESKPACVAELLVRYYLADA